VLKHEDFAQGKISTRWVESNMESNSLPQERAPVLQSLIAAALADVVFAGAKSQPAVSNETDPFSPWKQTNNYRVSDQ
jgi:hypothetical protein